MNCCSFSLPLVLVFSAFGFVALTQGEEDWPTESVARGEALFVVNCAACHSLEADGIGPPLGGVTQLYSRSAWVDYVRDPAGAIESGDLRANALFARHKLVMPGFPMWLEEEYAAVYDYLGERSASLGLSPLEIDLTRSFQKGERVVAPVQDSGLVLEVEDFASVPLAADRSPVKGIATLRSHPSGDGRLWVSDQMGVIYSVAGGKVVPVLDLRSRTPAFIFDPGIGTGLGSFAFHPGYLGNGLLYTTHAESYSGLPALNDGDFPSSIPVPLQWVVTEWKLGESSGAVGVERRREVLRFNTPTTAHGAQDIGFAPLTDPSDPDFGKLYVGIGDGGSNNIKMPELCHSIGSVLGTIIRIDPLGTNGVGGRYGVPSDNPFVGSKVSRAKEEIWAYGFRNPHRMCWDYEYGMRLLVADVGESNVEEINEVIKGSDYGWSVMEGELRIAPKEDLKTVYEVEDSFEPGIRRPWGQFDHLDGRAISGGFVYRGSIRALWGKYVFGDIVTGRVFYMNVDAELSDTGIYELGLSRAGEETSVLEMSGQKRANLRIGYDETAKELFLMTKADGAVRRVVDAYPKKSTVTAWRSLFNGKDLQGWVVVDPPIRAEVRDAGVALRMTPHSSRHSFLRTKEVFDDFIFEVEFRRDEGMDSGVLLRAKSAPDDAYSALFGYMVKIDPRQQRRWTGGVFLDFGDGWNWLYDLEGDERAQAAELPVGEWNHLRVEAVGDFIKVWLNGTPTAHLLDDRYESGYIALKAHFLNQGNASKEGLEILYRNARILTEGVGTYQQPMDLPVLDTRLDVAITKFR